MTNDSSRGGIDHSKRTALKLLGAGTAVAALGAGGGAADDGRGLQAGDSFESPLVGVSRPFTGDENPVRGLDGGGLPWVVDEGDVELEPDGSLEVEVEGLVIDPDDDEAEDEGLAGQNPLSEFKAIVSCLTVEDGEADVVNVSTETVSASEDGEAEVEAYLDLPDPCFAPVVFVTSGGGSWLAVTGF
ncbi:MULTISPECIES: hypothetical protein [Halorussus]|uniref:hypothetical protein n=1 Tax=Halorussus TaxID=1070314 RepID=UPI000E214F4F|nr:MULTISPECIES: hypothetical protein [Halorussus]NHN58806.1 hypothetical protein [Halorussus sp. JP-T4]